MRHDRIASAQAAVNYELPVLAPNIEDNADNITRFAIISAETSAPTGNDKTALMFEIAHRPGALADTSGYSPDLNVTQKIQLLEALDVVERLKLALQLQQERLTELVVRKRIREDVEGGAQNGERFRRNSRWRYVGTLEDLLANDQFDHFAVLLRLHKFPDMRNLHRHEFWIGLE